MDGERVFTLWDDAMISMRYARNLAAGQGLVWNVGQERVQGFSNLGLTLLMALLHLAPVSAAKIPLLFQIANLVLATLTALYTGKLTGALTGSRSAAVVSVLTVASLAPLGIWAAQG